MQEKASYIFFGDPNQGDFRAQVVLVRISVGNILESQMEQLRKV